MAFTVTCHINGQAIKFEDLKKYTITKKSAIECISKIAERINSSTNDKYI